MLFLLHTYIVTITMTIHHNHNHNHVTLNFSARATTPPNQVNKVPVTAATALAQKRAPYLPSSTINIHVFGKFYF